MRKTFGFTIVELSVVLVVVAMLLAFALSVGATRIETQRYQLTYERLKLIDAAMDAYMRQYKRLPCPADPELAIDDPNFGWEKIGTDPRIPCDAANITGMATAGNTESPKTMDYTLDTGALLTNPAGAFYIGNCSADPDNFFCNARGAVPAKDLGLNPVDTVDGWDNKIQYEMNTVYAQPNDIYDQDFTIYGVPTDAPTGFKNAMENPYFNPDYDGLETVSADWIVTGSLKANTTSGSNNVFYFLHSNGANGSGAYSMKGGASTPFVYWTDSWLEHVNNKTIDTDTYLVLIPYGSKKNTDPTTDFIVYYDDIFFYKPRHLILK